MNKQLAKTLLFSALFFTFLAISVWGYLSAQVPILEALYRSIQLFMLEANFDDVQLPLNWQLETARFVLPLFTIVAVISAALSYFKTQLSLLRCQLFPTEAIFLGCGKTARSIAINLPKGKTILLVDNTPQQAIPSKFAKQHRTTFLIGDALSRSFIAKLPLSKSKDIYIFTGNDQQDLDIALLVINILLAVGKPHHPLPRLIIDIDDIVLLETAQHDPRFKQYRASGGELVWFSAQKQAARALLLKHPVLASSSKGQDVIHIAICGFTELQQNVVLHILRTSIYLHSTKLHFSVFSDEREPFDRFLRRYFSLFTEPAKTPQSKVNTALASIECFETSLEMPFPELLDQAIAKAGTQQFHIAYVHNTNDFTAFFRSQRVMQSFIAANIDTRVICVLSGSHITEQSEVAKFVGGNPEAFKGIQMFFYPDELVHSGDTYPCQALDALGVTIHSAYKALYRPIKPNECRWENFSAHLTAMKEQAKNEWSTTLAPAFMWSSRHAADHLSIKLRELGFELTAFQQSNKPQQQQFIVQLTEELVKLLPQLMLVEHRRFIAERLVDGWVYGEVNNKALKINNTLVPYHELPKDELDKDEAMIRVIPHLLS